MSGELDRNGRVNVKVSARKSTLFRSALIGTGLLALCVGLWLSPWKIEHQSRTWSSGSRKVLLLWDRPVFVWALNERPNWITELDPPVELGWATDATIARDGFFGWDSSQILYNYGDGYFWLLELDRYLDADGVTDMGARRRAFEQASKYVSSVPWLFEFRWAGTEDESGQLIGAPKLDEPRAVLVLRDVEPEAEMPVVLWE